jgi:cytochrome c biogenesis protein CcmG/thiol:disulfide interchange protein DsbE
MSVKVRLFWFGLPLLVFLGLLVIFYNALQNDPRLLPAARLDKPIPAFALPDLLHPDQTITQSDLKGPLLLNVWATWCPACVQEHPFLLTLAGQGVRIVGLNYKDEPEAAAAYLDKHRNPYEQIILDVRGDLGFDLGVYGAPETYLIDAQGLIKYRHVGELNKQVWLKHFWSIWPSSPADAASPTLNAE